MTYNKLNAIWKENNFMGQQNTPADEIINGNFTMTKNKLFDKLINLDISTISDTEFPQIIAIAEQLSDELRQIANDTTNLNIATKWFNKVEKLADKFNL